MKKRGMGHLEVILSFVIFITAVGFALYFFSPANSDRLVDYSMDYAFSEIENNASSFIYEYTIKVNGSSNGINAHSGAIAVNLSSDLTGYNISVIDSSGQVLVSKISGSDWGVVYFNNNGRTWGTSDLVRAYVGKGFPAYSSVPNDWNNLNLKKEYYEVASVSRKKVLVEEQLDSLNTSYWGDYGSLKTMFNLPGRVDFGFSVKFSNGDKIIAKKQVPSGIDVFSESKGYEIIRKDGKIDSASMEIQIW